MAVGFKFIRLFTPLTTHTRRHTFIHTMAPQIKLTDKEQEICTLLQQVATSLHQTHPADPPLTLRIAGGWVRDKLLGKESHDIDIAIDHMSGFAFASHINAHLAQHSHTTHSIAKITQNPERSKHLETATTSVLGQAIDFVNLRSETYSAHSRVPEIQFGTPLEDARRRDITINALFYNIATQSVEDFTCMGMDDLKNRVVRTPMDPTATFRDDPLRVLRVVRFASRLGFSIDEETRSSMGLQSVLCDFDAKISRERVGAEVEKMASEGGSQTAIALMVELGIYPHVFVPPSRDTWLAESRVDVEEAVAMTRAVVALIESREVDVNDSLRSVDSAFDLAHCATRRRLVLAAYLWPYRGIVAHDSMKKGRVLSVAQIVARDALKLSNADAEAVALLHDSVSKIAECAERCENATVERKELGLQIREFGTRWLMAAVFAATACRDPKRIAKYVETVEEMGLGKAFAEKHAVDGKTAARLLGIKPGPVIRGVLDQIMEWQLENPHATRAECEEFVVDVVGPRVLK